MLTDPRTFPDPGSAAPLLAQFHALAASSLGAATGAQSEALDRRLTDELRRWLDEGAGDAIAELLATAPSVDVHRHLVRLLARAAEPDGAENLVARIFAIPVVLVAASTAAAGSVATLDGVLPDAEAIVGALQQHGALGGNRTIALANALVPAHALAPAQLPKLLAAVRLVAVPAVRTPLELEPAPIEVPGASEGAHLRFLVGTALAAPRAPILRETGVGAWGMPLARVLTSQLRAPEVTVLALPRGAQSPVTAPQAGRIAQREASAQLFASNAIRRLRTEFGEPSAVISAHRLAHGGGEVRLSLSTPFDPREAEGFRAPLHPFDRAGDVAAMLVDLLHDCRVSDIRIVDGVHADRDPSTGLAVLFKPETIPDGAPVTLH